MMMVGLKKSMSLGLPVRAGFLQQGRFNALFGRRRRELAPGSLSSENPISLLE